MYLFKKKQYYQSISESASARPRHWRGCSILSHNPVFSGKKSKNSVGALLLNINYLVVREFNKKFYCIFPGLIIETTIIVTVVKEELVVIFTDL